MVNNNDCYFYTELFDMGAIIPQCIRYKKIGECPCDNCNYAINKKEVYGIVIKHLEDRNDMGGDSE